MLNVPLISDTLAVRAVVFSDHQGGYISNVPGTIGYLPNSPQVLAGVNPIANNASLLQNNTNPVDYEGARLSALYKINDDWKVLLQQNYQDVQADGYFYTYPDWPRMAKLFSRIRSPLSRRLTTRIATRARPGRSMARSMI